MAHPIESILEALLSSRISEDSLNGRLAAPWGLCLIVHAEPEQTTALGNAEVLSHVHVSI
jgi:hypothetical protein